MQIVFNAVLRADPRSRGHASQSRPISHLKRQTTFMHLMFIPILVRTNVPTFSPHEPVVTIIT